MSSPVTSPPGEFTCGEWTVRPELNRIERDGASVRLQPRVMDVLVYLAERARRVVPKAELVDALWPEEFVADAVLNRALCELRRALGDDPADPRFIETIPKRGYRLVARVGPDREGRPGSAERTPEPARATSEPAPRLLGPVVCGYLVWGADEILLPPGEHVIGRSQEAAVVIHHPKISRAHARVSVTAQGATIEDLGSTNGTFVGGRRVEGPVVLTDGDQISLGPVELVYRTAGDRTTRI